MRETEREISQMTMIQIFLFSYIAVLIFMIVPSLLPTDWPCIYREIFINVGHSLPVAGPLRHFYELFTF